MSLGGKKKLLTSSAETDDGDGRVGGGFVLPY